jgi:hypothetical protein
MVAEFYASESTSIAVPARSIPIAHYLRQPQRVVNAVTEKSRVELLKHSTPPPNGHSFFRLKMQPLSFLQVTIQPTVDLDVWTEPDGTVHMRSIRTQIRGTDWINQRFALKLAGKIAPQVDRHGRIRLVGKVELKVNVELPPIFFMTPAIVLEATGNSLLKSVLLTMKRRLVQRLVADYLVWVKNSCDITLTNSSAIETI